MKLIADTHLRGFSAELLVAYRFLEAGRPPCLPLLPRPYDLVVDGGDQLYRVQVRCASPHIAPRGTARTYSCHLTKDRKVPIPTLRFDYLCAVIDANRVYVIPTGALHCVHEPGRLVKRVDIAERSTRFAAYLNQFGIGHGESQAWTPLTPLPGAQRSFWHVDRAGRGRKTHRRLSVADVDAIRRLPIALTREEEQDGRLPAAQIAAQFGIHVATLRNLLRGKRQDLQKLVGA